MEIKKTAIVGMGALGMMYGEHIQENLGKDSVCFVMDQKRYEKHKNECYTVNGVKKDFTLVTSEQSGPVDFIIVATKYSGLESALDEMKNLIDENTIILSVMNGISSEQYIAQRYNDKNLIYCVALGMDAMRENSDLIYHNKGKLQIGIVKEEQRPALEAVKQFFDKIGLVYEEKPDILRALWGKLLLNVGINQTCMVYEATYEGVLNTKEYFDAMSGAMHEVMAVAQKEGVMLSEADYENYVELIRTLNPKGYPSMRQDAIAKRKSEVELFAGTIVRTAKKHNVSVPVNQFYYERIQEIENGYEKIR